jgi:Ca2+-binding RTX toxin-like protein
VTAFRMIPSIGPRRRRAIATAVFVSLVGMPTAARAAVTCSFAGGTVQVTLGAAEDEASVVRDGDDIVVRDGIAEIACGGPTVTTVDTIRANDVSSGTTTFTIDLSGGPFEPGATDEEDGTSEIEFSVDLGGGFPDRLTIIGTSGPDDILFSALGINQNNAAEPLAVDKDWDVTTAGVEEHAVEAGDGDDIVSGDATLPGPFPSRLLLDGQGGHDTLTGGTAADELAGGDDDDDLLGGDGADELSGGPGADELDGESGDDELFGGGDADLLEGGPGADTLDGGGGADTEMGESGDDVFDQGADPNGADTLEGGDGFDLVAFDLRDGPLAVTVGIGADDGEAGEGDDIGSDVEGVLGGSGNDDITGNDEDNVLRGGPGNDDIDGGDGDDVVDGDAGNDDLEGGDGDDTASFFGAPAVTASLATGSATGEGTDTLSGFEHLEGGAHGDALTGDGGDNVLTGRGGADALSGGAGNDELRGGEGDDTLAGEAGDDLLRGNGGVDTASFAGSAAPVAVNIGAGTATGEGTDTLVGIENAIGGPAGDTLVGNDQPNLLVGGGGKDTILGFGGSDDLRGQAGDDTIDGGSGNDTIAGGDGQDVLTGASGADRFLEGEQKGPNGADTITGGPGSDLVSYGGRKNRVRVTIGAAAGDGQKGEGDRVGADVERVRGTTRNDVLIGNGAKNTLIGGAGDDILKGRGGRDRLIGGGGNDRLDGGPGPDVCRGGGGRNVLRNCGKKKR